MAICIIIILAITCCMYATKINCAHIQQETRPKRIQTLAANEKLGQSHSHILGQRQLKLFVRGWVRVSEWDWEWEWARLRLRVQFWSHSQLRTWAFLLAGQLDMRWQDLRSHFSTSPFLCAKACVWALKNVSNLGNAISILLSNSFLEAFH